MRIAMAEDERTALRRILNRSMKFVNSNIVPHAVLVGHNAHFDLWFYKRPLLAQVQNQNPFHSFSVMDTVTLSAMFGQTVLAKACIQAGIEFDGKEAHSALYDTQKTAELFCYILNKLSPYLLDSLVAAFKIPPSSTSLSSRGLGHRPFHGGNRGSNPRRDAIFSSYKIFLSKFCLLILFIFFFISK